MRRIGILTILLALAMLSAVPAAALEPFDERSPTFVPTAADSGDAAALDMAMLAESFGEDTLIVSYAIPGRNYVETENAGGTVLLPAEGADRLIIVENADRRVLWAGVFGGGTEDVLLPMAQWEHEEPSADGENTGLTLDVTELAAGCGESLCVQVSADGESYEPFILGREKTVQQVPGKAEKWYVLIGTDTEGMKDYIWAGVFSGDDAAGRIVFHPTDSFFDPAAWTPEPATEEAEETDMPTPTAAPTETPVPVFDVQILEYSGIYDGMQHSVEAVAEQPDVTYRYSVCAEEDDAPDGDWINGLPSLTDAGEQWAFVQAEKDGYRPVYQDEDGIQQNDGQEWIKVHLLLQPVPLTVELTGEQIGEAVYDGSEQTVPVKYHIRAVSGASDLFPQEALEKDAGWTGEGQVTGKDAGSYPIEEPEEQIEFIKSYDANFAVTVRWKESEVRILPKPIEFGSASAVALYEPSVGSLTASEMVRGVRSIADGDYFSGDVTARGEQRGVGVSSNGIVLSGRFAERQSNYSFDLAAGTGKLAIFPQSISDNCENWDMEQAMEELARYDDQSAEELPSYYAGMQVSLERDLTTYNGAQKTILVRFCDKQGESMVLTENEDYTVAYFRDGEETEDLTNPGEITVLVTGKGGYTGTVELRYVIEAALANVSVVIDDWIYDGKSAGSQSHPITANGPYREPVYTYFDENGREVPAPKDAGRYTLKASWDETVGYSAAEATYAFSISPAELTVYAGDGIKTYGDQEPALAAAKIDGLADGDEVEYTVRRETGEDAGSYETIPEVLQEQPNYIVRYVGGTFTIKPLSIDDATVKAVWSGAGPTVRQNGNALTPGKDYTVSAVETADEMENCVVTGCGNFTGERRITRERTTVEEFILDEAAFKKTGTLQGSVRFSQPVDIERSDFAVDGREYSVQWTEQGEASYHFELVDAPLQSEGTDVIRTVILLDGEEAAAQILRPSSQIGPIVWGCAAAGLALAALISLMICLRMTKRLRKEREKLLDTVSRQSGRTVRQSESDEQTTVS